MTPLEIAVLRTLLYADIFQCPLTFDELHRYLIHDRPINRNKLQSVLQQSHALVHILWQRDGYLGLREHEAYLQLRQKREQYTAKMWERATRYGRWLGCLPFVRMVALTGALAVRNPSQTDDDYDYILVTEPGRVWLARAFAVLLVRLMRLRGVILCPNYVLAKDRLVQEQRDLYVAHEIMQMVPIYGGVLYGEMLQANRWTRDYLPNAQPYPGPNDVPSRLKRIAEWLLSGVLGNWLERWEYRRKMQKFQREMHAADDAARVDESQVKGHFQDHGSPVLERFLERESEYGLLIGDTDDAIAQAGD